MVLHKGEPNIVGRALDPKPLHGALFDPVADDTHRPLGDGVRLHLDHAVEGQHHGGQAWRMGGDGRHMHGLHAWVAGNPPAE